MITKNYIERPSKRHLKFKDLKVGQVFFVSDCCGNDLHMKTREIINYHGDAVNCINLESGDIDYLDDDDEVWLINKKINITFSDDDIVEWTTEKED